MLLKNTMKRIEYTESMPFESSAYTSYAFLHLFDQSVINEAVYFAL